MKLNILRCSLCDKQLNDFETSKVHALQEYWGGTRKIQPKCRGCYHMELQIRKANAGRKAGNQEQEVAA